MPRDIGSVIVVATRWWIRWVSALIGASWWVTRVYAIRLVRACLIPPLTIPACKIDPADAKPGKPFCDHNCTNPVYRGGNVSQADINGKTWYICCPKGYAPSVVKDPVTGEVTDVTCQVLRG